MLCVYICAYMCSVQCWLLVAMHIHAEHCAADNALCVIVRSSWPIGMIPDVDKRLHPQFSAELRVQLSDIMPCGVDPRYSIQILFTQHCAVFVIAKGLLMIIIDNIRETSQAPSICSCLPIDEGSVAL